MYTEERADDDPATGEDYCTPYRPVRIGIIHGTADTQVPYNTGGGWPPPYNEPYGSVPETLRIWRNINECYQRATAGIVTLDLVPGIAGAETEYSLYASQCHLNGSTEHWKVNGAGHGINWDLDAFRDQVFGFFERYERQMVLFEDKDTLVFPAAPDTLSWDLSRGVLDLSLGEGFVDGDGDGLHDGGYGNCLTDPVEIVGPTYDDTTEPLPGELLYYVSGRTDDKPPASGGGKPGQYGMTGRGKDRQNNCPVRSR
jgi:hypothetical protein